MSVASLHHILWEGTVPVAFELCPDYSASFGVPLTVHKIVPRMSYLAIHCLDVIQYFQTCSVQCPDCNDDIQFIANNIILPSHIPLGPLFDMIHDGGSKHCFLIQVSFNSSVKNTQYVPPYYDSTERIFFHNLKQSLHICYGTTRRFNELTIEQQRALWEAVKIGSFSLYKNNVTWGNALQLTEQKAIPLRILFSDGTIFQKSIKLSGAGESGSSASLHSVLECDFHIPCRIIAQGIEVDTTVSIEDLWINMHHPDLFLYLYLPLSYS